MISVAHLAVRSGNFELHDVCFEVAAGTYAVLMGKTGSGKTTLLESLCGLRPVLGGNIVLAGRDVTHLPAAQRGIGYVPQDGALFSHMTVRQQLGFPLEIRRWSRPQIAARVGELAKMLSLEKLLDRLPRGLSGGEQQRVALGRALSFAPGVLLLDEPLSALDEESREQAYEVLSRVQRLTHVTVLHITHNAEECQRLADQSLRMVDGSVNDMTSSPANLQNPINNESLQQAVKGT
jgi:ABC-type sugar transport system ATPase subunit